MERERRLFRGFLSVHERKAVPTDEPVAYLQFYNECMPVHTPLIKFTKEDVMKELDCDAELVRFLLHQLSTYDCTTQRIVGLIFDKRTVLSDVLLMPP